MKQFKHIILFATFILFLYRCDYKIANEDLTTDEKNIYNLMLDLSLAPDSLVRSFYYNPITLGIHNSVLTERQRKTIDSLKVIYDTISLNVYIDDTLRNCQSELNTIKDDLQLPYFSESFKNIDTSFIPLINNLIYSSYNRKIDLSFFKIKYNYKIKSLNKYKNLNDKLVEASSFQFSNIMFDNKHQKACVYVQRRKVMPKPYGSERTSFILFFVRKSNIWTLYGEHTVDQT